ncbi:hypothetical protein [Vibrio owensii]|uniref:hypothetical protein n=1 Tax=Vibrio harveyi group TaxID=717610 RepID=UPI003CC50929
MKAKELAEELLQHPEYEVTASVDISVSGKEETYTDRVFGSGLNEVMAENHRERFTMLFETSFDNTGSRQRISQLEEMLESMISGIKNNGKLHHSTLAKAERILGNKAK